MHSVESEPVKCLLKSLEEDVLVKQIILTHDPDNTHQINSATLLQSVQDVMFHTNSSSVSRTYLESVSGNDECNSLSDSHATLGQVIYAISSELLCVCSEDRDLHTKTMTLFDLLGNFKWDTKVVLVLAAFAISYGEFWLVSQLHPLNPLAVAVAQLKQLPTNLSAFKPQLKALSSLVKTMVDVAEFMIENEGLRIQHSKLDDKENITMDFQIYVSAYWVIRSSFTCSSLITDMIANPSEQVKSTSTANAAWELSSLVYKMSSISKRLKKKADVYHLVIEDLMHQKLLFLSKEGRKDNQEMLHILFGLTDDTPLRDSLSQKMVGLSELVNKVVILLISKPVILPTHELLFLIQQTSSGPQRVENERGHEIVWVPISSSSWTDVEIETFTHFSNNLPWYSLRKPWLLSKAALNYIKQMWEFIDEPLMVVLDTSGTVTSINAMDMIYIWGVLAYPFSTLKEEQLWQETSWSLQLVISEIDPSLLLRVQQGKPVCLYGSDDLNWIREFTSVIKDITSTGIQLELVYVGCRKPGENVSKILTVIAQENLSSYLSHHNIQYFWLHLESIIRSKSRLGKTVDDDRVLKEITFLMDDRDMETVNGWALFGEGTSSDTVLLRGRQLMDQLKLHSLWEEDIGILGFSGALKRALEPPVLAETCYNCSIAPYTDEALSGGTMVFCEKCKNPMKKFVFYQCQGITTE
ncbi:hypothetical protein Sjap_016327 [Stephania japonica]|uniref:Sieve element occlusion n=1 Tax=Stephania japonica TaxID=461633 RepID=A0AAP0ILD3_9MAGN